MENKRGNGIFLGIVSVATLIVAIIGATFAYFSATTSSEENAVDLGAYEFSLDLDVTRIYPVNPTQMIPLAPGQVITNAQAPNNTNLLYALNVAENRCIDDNGLQVCALYQVAITNNATNDITLSGSIKTMSNEAGTGENATGFTNLTYQQITGNHTQNNLALAINPTTSTAYPAVTLEQEAGGITDIADIEIPGATKNSAGALVPGVGYSYVLIYLNDNANQSAEMGAKYTGQLIYSSKDGSGNTLTGTFNVAAPSEPADPTTTEPADPTTGSGE